MLYKDWLLLIRHRRQNAGLPTIVELNVTEKGPWCAAMAIRDMSEPIHLHSRPALRPNWNLKAAREWRGWSQQELADHLKITPNSISRWERGISSPGPYFRRQLCDLFGMSLEELGLASQSIQTGSASFPAIWHVPFQRNPFFTGREEVLLRLQERLSAGERGARVPLALCGLAGMGKTQTAVEYCYRFSAAYQAMLWVRADMRETLVADLVTIATSLELVEPEEREQDRAVEAVRRWLHGQRDWLLVLDNLEDLSFIGEFIPPLHQGQVLLTMHRQATGTLAHYIELPQMDQEEAVLFLLRRAKLLPLDAPLEVVSPAARSAAAQIVQLLGGLPLALDQAGAYIEETACGLSEYLERYRMHRTPLLQQRGSAASGHPASLATTFSLLTAQVEMRNASAANLLKVCAFLHPDTIPEAMIVEGVAPNDSVLGPLVHDPYALDAVIKTLRDFSLIQRDPQSKTLSLHRLVQAVIQDRMSEPVRHQWAEWTVALVSRAFPYSGDSANWSHCQQYLPQALACGVLIEQCEIVSLEAGILLWKTGAWLMDLNQYARAENLLLKARAILLSSVGEGHIDYAHCLNDLALLYHYWGRYEQAEPLYRQVLQIYEQLLGTEHEDFAVTLNNLGGLFYCQGKYAQAEPVLLRALAICEKQLGTEHPQVIPLLQAIVDLYMLRGKYTQAEPILQRALAICERCLGPDHPHTLHSLSYVASLYVTKKQYQRAESLYRHILEAREKQLGTEHYGVGTCLRSLARLYQEQGLNGQAEELYRQALDILERALGPEHPLTAQTLNDLARLLLQQGQLERGEELCRRALTIREQKLGTQHPDYADSLAMLALLDERRGDENRAMQLYQQALAICEGKLMPEHPLVLRCQGGLSRLLAKEQVQPITDLPPSTTLMPDTAPERAGDTEQAAVAEQTPLDGFLVACCERHPRAWCRAADLWSAYQRWTEEHGERFPLSRRAFAAALKQQGCRPDRTNEYRIWRGISLHAHPSEDVTPGDVM
jgi:tetratricopeptide (TPR) repeat protein/transcriptional regulator with XRE-family HTH domain